MFLQLYTKVRDWSRQDLTAVTAFGSEKTSGQKNIFLWKTNLYLSQKDSYLHQSKPSTVFWKSFVQLNARKISFFYRFSPCLTNKSQHARPWSTAAILFVTLLWWSSTQILGYCRPNYFSRSALESHYVFCVCNVCLILCVFLPTLDGIAAAAAAYRRPSCDLRGGIYG